MVIIAGVTLMGHGIYLLQISSLGVEHLHTCNRVDSKYVVRIIYYQKILSVENQIIKVAYLIPQAFGIDHTNIYQEAKYRDDSLNIYSCHGDNLTSLASKTNQENTAEKLNSLINIPW